MKITPEILYLLKQIKEKLKEVDQMIIRSTNVFPVNNFQKNFVFIGASNKHLSLANGTPSSSFRGSPSDNNQKIQLLLQKTIIRAASRGLVDGQSQGQNEGGEIFRLPKTTSLLKWPPLIPHHSSQRVLEYPLTFLSSINYQWSYESHDNILWGLKT